MKRETEIMKTPWAKIKLTPGSRLYNNTANFKSEKEEDNFRQYNPKAYFDNLERAKEQFNIFWLKGLMWGKGKTNNEVASFIKTRKVKSWNKAKLDALLEEEPVYKKKRPYNKTMKHLAAHGVWEMRFYSKGQFEFLYRLGIILGFTGWKQIYAYLSLTDLSITEIQKRINSINNRIEARRYTNGMPAAKATTLYIIKVDKMVKFGIADDFLNRMRSYMSEFGSYELIETIALDNRRTARNIEKEMIKYFKRIGKVVRGHEYTNAHPDEVISIRNLMTSKVFA